MLDQGHQQVEGTAAHAHRGSVHQQLPHLPAKLMAGAGSSGAAQGDFFEPEMLAARPMLQAQARLSRASRARLASSRCSRCQASRSGVPLTSLSQIGRAHV